MADPAKNHISATTLLQNIENGSLTADELVSHYAALVYLKTGSYEETARSLGLDRRTAKSKVEKFLSSATR